jgi:hypothetical protein
MKRNWDTIRKILIKIESLEPNEYLILSMFDEKEHDEVYYHIKLLLEAGLIEGKIHTTISKSPHEFHIERLSWNGHEFLDAIKIDTHWNKIKKHIKSKGIDLGFDIIKITSLSIAKTLLM